jgi:glycolate oxidase FAD binding subunit
MCTAARCHSPTCRGSDRDAMMEGSLAELRDRILAAARARAPLRLRGAGTKDFYGERLAGDVLDTRGHAGIVSYEPSELVITARCGTPLSQIEQALAASNQFLPFEPPAFGGDPTIGGVVAAGLSGPRRANAGAVRDFVLGAHLLDARGEALQFGGQVMKNVAGFDVARLLCGSLGVLGLITQVSLKVLPRPRAEVTLSFECNAVDALERFNRWGGKPLPVSATAWCAGRATVRLSGAGSAVQSARAALGGEIVDDDQAAIWWNSLRHQTHARFVAGTRLWRLSLPSAAPVEGSDRSQEALGLIEWGGALRWLRSDAPAAEIRAAAAALGGTASLWCGTRDTSMFHPLAPASLQLHRRLKQQFDPPGIFNPGRLIADL